MLEYYGAGAAGSYTNHRCFYSDFVEPSSDWFSFTAEIHCAAFINTLGANRVLSPMRDSQTVIGPF